MKKSLLKLFIISLFSNFLLLSGCGGGGAVGGDAGGGTTPTNALPQVQNVATTGNDSDIDVTFDLVDTDAHSCSLRVEYFDGTQWKLATVTGATINVAPNANLSLIWKSATDEPGVLIANCQIRITPTDTEEGTADTCASFQIDNRGFKDIGVGLPGVSYCSLA